MRRIEGCARELKTGGALSLRVLCSLSLALKLVPQAVAETAQRFPEAMISMEAQLVREMVGLLAAGQADVAISSLPVDRALLESTSLGEWTLSCVFPAAIPSRHDAVSGRATS